MLTGLSIRDIVLIEALDLEFGAGLDVLTGETGAGKSILLDSLGLALGMRADSGLVRHGAERGQVSATFDPPAPGSPLARLLDENGIGIEPSEPLIVRRSVRADGGSRAFLSDQPCSAALLREVGALLVEIHGQHDDRGLLNPRGHRRLLDSFGALDTAATAAAHRAWRDAEALLADARVEVETAAADREWLDHSIVELEAFDPQEDEEEVLSTARADMQMGQRLTDELSALDALLQGSEGGLAQLRQAGRRLDRIAPEHALLGEALAALDRAVIEAAEAEEALERAGEALRFDPAELDRIETRLFDLRALARKHRIEPDALPVLLQELRARRDRLEAGEGGLAALESEVTAKWEAYRHAAADLTAARVAAAKRLDAAVAAELAPLKLEAARFRTAIDPLDEAQWGPHGADRVEFMIATNPGAPFAPLTKIASGGELSRFILALKVALAEEGGVDTMIFDEIDRGVGGAVASAIGERLARLAQKTQVLVVTHSPQVAARGSQHLLIAKRSDGIVTRTGVHVLDESARREEIARMLSGAEITHEARAQADRLLEGV